MRIRHAENIDKIELQMTPMIDIVFQLNIFFLFTFKIILPEGDFNIHMPSAAAALRFAYVPPIMLPLPPSMTATAGDEGEGSGKAPVGPPS